MDGLLIINKEKGFTSFDVVAKLRGILGEKKIGHLGTLDPEAEGVLPVCVGKATRLAPLLSGGEKVYRATLLLGITTDTQDTTGRLLRRSDVPDDKETVLTVIRSFVGEQNQFPPMVSAKKVDGKKLVDLARQGKEVERKPARITIREIEILRMNLPRAELRIFCSSGTYIRTLCHDIGEKLGCGGCMESLVREEASGFSVKDAVYTDEVTSLALTGTLPDKMIPLPALLGRYPSFICRPEADSAAINGNPIKIHQGSLTGRAADDTLFHVLTSDSRSVGIFALDKRRSRLSPQVMLGPSEEKKNAPPRGSVVSIGKFDGVHLGHQAIVKEMLRQAEAEKLGTVLFSFTNPPESLTGNRKADLICTADQKRLLLKDLGIRKIVEARFTAAMRNMPAETFLKDVLIGRFGMKRIVVGPDCSFGKGREGNVEFLQSHAAEFGYTLTVVEKVRMDGEIISSSRIKSLLEEGRMEEAARCLGRPFTVSGRVVYGRHLGETIGFPTINLSLQRQLVLPPFGVYAVRCELDGTRYQGMGNLGVKPTVEKDAHPSLEVHLFDTDACFYGLPCRAELLHYVRPEQAFENLESLKKQLAADKITVKNCFEGSL